MDVLDQRLDTWKKQLFDLGKRNRLINYKESKRKSLEIASPSCHALFKKIVEDDETLTFKYAVSEVQEDVLRTAFPEIRVEKPADTAGTVVVGDIETCSGMSEQQKTLLSLRNTARLAQEEQGINVLYMALGFLNWVESEGSGQALKSPLVLVPVVLSQESISSPYTLSLHEDEIVVNPTLAFKLEHDFGLKFPAFDAEKDSLDSYFKELTKLVSTLNWTVEEGSSLAILSFLKISMFFDLERNAQRIKEHPIIGALSGKTEGLRDVPTELQGDSFDHDSLEKPVDTFQVVDADSSQLDAITLSKRGVSFVLQGPPGTGKSQTITNIIAEAMADGKKVLFVSEKMAALEVVQHRLAKSNLSDFCLTLHSTKTNKIDVLSSLHKMLDLAKTSVKEEAIQQLSTLERDRAKINEYVRQLHAPISLLNKSIYDINGFLASLEQFPDISFAIKDIESITPEALNLRCDLLDELGRTFGHGTSEFSNSPWFNCISADLSHELRHDIETIFCRVQSKFCEELDSMGRLGNGSFSDVEIPYCDTEKWVEFLQFCSTSPKIPVEWLYDEEFDDLFLQAAELGKTHSEYHLLKTEVEKKCQPSIFNLDVDEAMGSIEGIHNSLSQKLNASQFIERASVYGAISDMLDNIRPSIDSLAELNNLCCRFAPNVDVPVPKRIEDAQNFSKFAKALCSDIRPAKLWFDKSHWSEQDLLLQDFAEQIQIIEDTKKRLFEKYEKEILGIDYSSLMVRFKTEYTNWFKKFFNPTYKSDVNQVRGMHRGLSVKLSDDEILETLCDVKIINESLNWVTEREATLKEFAGGHYGVDQKAIERVFESIRLFRHITDYYHGSIPEHIRTSFMDGTNVSIFESEVEELENLLNNSSLQYWTEKSILGANVLSMDFAVFSDLLEALENDMAGLQNCVLKIADGCKAHYEYDEYIAIASKLQRMQVINREILEREDALRASFAFLYLGIETDWDQVLSLLKWTSKYRDYLKKYNIPNELQALICSDDEAIHNAALFSGRLDDLHKATYSDIEWADSLFDSSAPLSNLGIVALSDRLLSCSSNLALLEEWIDFRNTRDRCADEGLSDFVDAAIELKMLPNQLSSVYKKRYYRLWLDCYLPSQKAVVNFRGAKHEADILKFVNNDVAQFPIAQARICQKIIEKLPRLSSMASGLDEVAILRREAKKKRRIMPLRKLFSAIPTLLPRLKPCLMMSPLSVSTFLESDNYCFDLVIFDEASQVCSANAIGAIFRGKQVIIAGDSKQLPPTNFFSASFDDDSDYDNDEVVDDTLGFESILDEASTVLANASLRWHYRSRNEGLIAFSNIKLYNNSLITFPSPETDGSSSGVRCEYVQDGCYDRSGKRNNIEEVKRIVDLIEKHICTHPDRSLGVITFSISQAQSIETYVRKFRTDNPQYEDFFDENNSEPFFVKNLENVQGDERDDILLSVGYAKDSHGRMFMNFGPINKSGGERRLNVAVTRAKIQLVLVCSIMPSDLSITDSSPEGVRLLKSYIDYANRGVSAIADEISYNDICNTESPFEESVYNFLASKGYSVATQVGCSGYRIDMAVKNPENSGAFVLGVECDGASYHSSRTARERDRLRQAVLEDIGWKIYRIWSTDWVKDQATEGRRLIRAVDLAMGTSVVAVEEVADDDLSDDATGNQTYFEDVSVECDEQEACDGFGMACFNPVDFLSMEESRRQYYADHFSEAILYVIAEEQPVHIDVLYKRLSCLCGREKVTVRVRDLVNSYLDGEVKKKVKKDRQDFYVLKENPAWVARVPQIGSVPRKVEHISIPELELIMKHVVANTFGITKDGLIKLVASILGYKRLGPDIVARLNKAEKALRKDDSINIIDGKYSFVSVE